MADEQAQDQPQDEVVQDQVGEQPSSDDASSAKPCVKVEDVGSVRKRLWIEVPADQIEEKVASSYSRLKDDAVVPGFRRGRVPQRLLEKRFGSSVRDDVRAQLITESYSQAIEDEGLEVVGEPDVKDVDKIELPESGPMTFEVEVEVSPNVQLPEFSSIEIKRPVIGISDDDANKELDQLRRRLGSLESVESHEVAEDHFVGCHVKVFSGHDPDDDAETIIDQEDAKVYVPSDDSDFRGHVLGIVVEDLRDRLIGAKVGDTVTIAMTGPGGHEDEKIKDQPITIVLQVNGLEVLKLAEMQSVMGVLGAETEEACHERLKESLTERQTQEQIRHMHQQICQHLFDHVELELPERLTGLQTLRILRRQAMELASRGHTREEIEQQIAQLRQGTEQRARRELKLFFILDQAGKDLDIDVSEAELNGRVAMIAWQQGRRPEKLRQQMQRKGELDSLYMLIREEKILNKILEGAKVVDEDQATASNAFDAALDESSPDSSSAASVDSEAGSEAESAAESSDEKE